MRVVGTGIVGGWHTAARGPLIGGFFRMRIRFRLQQTRPAASRFRRGHVERAALVHVAKDGVGPFQ